MDETITDDWTRQLAFMETYDQSMELFDHERNPEGDPLSVIGMHPGEDAVTGNRLEVLMCELIACGIPEQTQTPLHQLLQYPRYLLDRLLRDGRKARMKQEADINQLNLDLSTPQ